MSANSIEERAVKLARYIIDTKDTVRGAAKKFGVSKSTVHKDVSQRLLTINYALALEVRKILDEYKYKIFTFFNYSIRNNKKTI